MPRPWLWGGAMGLLVGGAVVFLSALRHGLSGPLLLLGVVLAIGFGGLALLDPVARHRIDIDGG